MHRGVEFCLLFDTRRHQPAGIKRDQNRLIALDLILARREFSASRSRRPRDVTQLVAAYVIAHRALSTLLPARDACWDKPSPSPALRLLFDTRSVWISI